MSSIRAHDTPAVGAGLVAGAAALWALIGVCTRELGELGLPAEQVGPWRALIGGGCFALQVAASSGRTRGDTGQGPGREPLWTVVRRRWVQVAGFCLVGVVVFYSALPLAVETGGISLAYVLLYTAPIWVTLGAAIWLGERLSRRQVLAVLVSVAGVVAIALSAGGTLSVSGASVGWGLVAGISYSSYYLMGRRLFEVVDPPALYSIVLPAGGVVLAALVGLQLPAQGMLVWLVLLGVGCTWLPYLLFARGVTRIASSRAVVVALVEPVLATVIGVALYGERLGPVGVLGVVVVLVVSTRMAAGD